MFNTNKEDDLAKIISQTSFDARAKKQREKYCVRDYSGDVFELTSDMLVKDHYFDPNDKDSLSATAECILRKYEKLLSIK
ncbi:MAG: hypothetical protein IKW39_06420 [Alphaproteobacteria bacterium]|nr:hypothetical protein [Alphaproteobacteria bacterium]